MTKHVFILGATGYVGGTVLKDFISEHPDLTYNAIVRTQAKGDKLTAAFPSVQIVIGDLDSADVIASESAKADLIFSIANCDHEEHIRSIYKGMAKHEGTSYLIHTSGTGVLTDPKLVNVGEAKQTELSDKLYDDVADVKTIVSLPDENLHRLVDRIVLEQAPENVKQCIICPPLIYGNGTGPDNRVSIQIPTLMQGFIKEKTGFKINSGTNRWSNVHVQDLADLYVLVANEALKPDGGKASWGPEAYYFAENGIHIWVELDQWIADELHKKGKLDSSELKTYNQEQVIKVMKFGAYGWGTNSLSKATRGRTLLGWSPTRPALKETLAATVDSLPEQGILKR